MLRFVSVDTLMGRIDILAGEAPVFLYFGSNGSNNVGSPFGFPWCEDGAGCQWFSQLSSLL
jgi:hypothetical protein